MGSSVSPAEQLAVQVSLLLIEVYITTYQLDKASHHLEMLENKLFKGQPSGASSQRDKEVGHRVEGVQRLPVELTCLIVI